MAGSLRFTEEELRNNPKYKALAEALKAQGGIDLDKKPEPILLPEKEVPKPEKIDWRDEVTVNEGFTIFNALLWTFALLFGIPLTAFFVMAGAVFPAAFVFIAALIAVYWAGRLRERVRVIRKAGVNERN